MKGGVKGQEVHAREAWGKEVKFCTEPGNEERECGVPDDHRKKYVCRMKESGRGGRCQLIDNPAEYMTVNEQAEARKGRPPEDLYAEAAPPAQQSQTEEHHTMTAEYMTVNEQAEARKGRPPEDLYAEAAPPAQQSQTEEHHTMTAVHSDRDEGVAQVTLPYKYDQMGRLQLIRECKRLGVPPTDYMPQSRNITGLKLLLAKALAKATHSG